MSFQMWSTCILNLMEWPVNLETIHSHMAWSCWKSLKLSRWNLGNTFVVMNNVPRHAPVYALGWWIALCCHTPWRRSFSGNQPLWEVVHLVFVEVPGVLPKETAHLISLLNSNKETEDISPSTEEMMELVRSIPVTYFQYTRRDATGTFL